MFPLVLALSAAADMPTRTVVITATQTTPYCGGAAPGPEQMERARTPVPVSGKTYLVRAGNKNTAVPPLAELTTDAEGKARVELEAGTYCLVEESKRRLEPAAPSDREAFGLDYDHTCLADQQQVCDLVIEVERGELPLEVDHATANRCFYRPGPCYVGRPISPPPSAAPGR